MLPLSVAYELLSQLAPFILEHQSKDIIASVVVNPRTPDQTIKLGNYTLNAGQSGSGLRLSAGERAIQRVRVYRYR